MSRDEWRRVSCKMFTPTFSPLLWRLNQGWAELAKSFKEGWKYFTTKRLPSSARLLLLLCFLCTFSEIFACLSTKLREFSPPHLAFLDSFHVIRGTRSPRFSPWGVYISSPSPVVFFTAVIFLLSGSCLRGWSLLWSCLRCFSNSFSLFLIVFISSSFILPSNLRFCSSFLFAVAFHYVKNSL